jgi:hypothetical protein
MKLPKNLRGKYVTRAAFAKMQAEKQRLKNDIYKMVMGTSEDFVEIFDKYEKEFHFWKDLEDGLREIAKKELPKLKEKYGIK